MSLRRAAIAAFGGALLLLTASTVNAQAADGPFSYIRADTGTPDEFDNPPNDTCLPIPGGAAHADNDTDATAFVYADSSCRQLLAIVGVGASWDETNPPPAPAHSVGFGSG
ncbi:hypothetical protein QZH56_12355 [Streptomyces olivoreticuli]|uniref:hypothetical protein n=1 Tax=Streptomyces olivoreticuli TaxID=68246 RepID=UPI0026595AA5|nr:hypothetical protein [Streptomyces olivoreticuli]WKK26312.1 hypothetical protein QZH56_12355 [Streptomyces olivoreticuli]